MYVIRLSDGTLRVPQSLTSDDGKLIGNAYVEIGPDDPDYSRLLAESLTEEEWEAKQRSWRDGNDELERQFLAFKAEQEAAD